MMRGNMDSNIKAFRFTKKLGDIPMECPEFSAVVDEACSKSNITFTGNIIEIPFYTLMSVRNYIYSDEPYHPSNYSCVFIIAHNIADNKGYNLQVIYNQR